MLGVGTLPPPPLLHKNHNLPFSLIFQHQTHKPLFNYSPLSISGRTGFCLFSQKKEKNPSFIEIKMDENDEEEEDVFEYFDDEEFDDEDEEFDDDEEDEDEDVDEDGEVMVPYNRMNDWLVKKPKGFGEGKVYDTALEDKLLEEIEQSVKAQMVNINKLKNEPIKPKPKNELQDEFFKGVPGGIRVRINNLPKKRNIHRDLKSAFEGIPGIINISPVNSGNKKTRDPVCKGLAFVDFKSLKDADSFVQKFSGQIVPFGKSEKPIKCEILKPLDAIASYGGSSFDEYNTTSEGTFTVLEDDEDDDVEHDFNELVEGPDGKYVLGNSEKLSASDRIKRIEMLEAKLLARAALYEEEIKAVRKEPEVTNKSDKKPNVKTDKKPNVKTDKKPNLKTNKKPKLSIPGSAKKLKVREKAKLADAFSRYGMKEAPGSKDM
ncbi:hypothetical protein BVRB_6g153390 [Beta vulgaris subsp. vulgaris]|uniref:uncharacterized protein LOC104897859 n=1 Tax=Beta vulgaris subsp. vulgaris TaxID=3555 RepID=UPI00054010CB|nr:uncharacterized protein LOC104897859 [Beta vulgaris subsp. vulgaris]KMT07007.1 hypothetical protein BVRB_6g153390 [Beta vulgaris subsp. vulgaris]